MEKHPELEQEGQVTQSSPCQCLTPLCASPFLPTGCSYPHLLLEGSILDQTFKILPNDVNICGFATVVEI